MNVPPHIALIRALNGDESTGQCCCPAHDDDTPSLSISAGHKRPIILFCHANCSYEAVTGKLREMGLWPVHGTDAQAPSSSRRHYSDEERRKYAFRILADVRRHYGEQLAQDLLGGYFARRGIDAVPPTALLAMSIGWRPDWEGFVPRIPAMIFPIVDHRRRRLGAHVTWLNGMLDGKADDIVPQRQCYGPIKGGFIELFEGPHDPARRLLIAEGVETAAAMAQLAGLPAISAISAKNMPLITPPRASEYIIGADNDANGVGQRAARALAAKLVSAGHQVRIATPPRPDTDWADVVCSNKDGD
jgi:putative DNA primase/helicase